MEVKRSQTQPYPAILTEAETILLVFASNVQAGFPSPATNYAAEEIDLNSYITQNPTATFLVKVEGDSMLGAHIEPDDLAVVDRSVKPASGKIVLAYFDGGFTIKRLLLRHNIPYLVPENPAYTTIKLNEGRGDKIWGVVVGVVKKL